MGGTDQKFNLLVGRHLQQIYGQAPQTIITLPLLEGLDGIKKMSKSANNYIALNDTPDDMFGKIMSLSDELMWRYFELVSTLTLKEINNLKSLVKSGSNPRDIKFQLAEELVSRFHNQSTAQQAKDSFLIRFQKGQIPSEVNTMEITMSQVQNPDGEINLPKLLSLTNLVSSVTEGHRAIKAGSIRINGEKVNIKSIKNQPNKQLILSFGKRRFIEVKII